MRKRALTKTAERIAQARAKAAATLIPIVSISGPDTNATPKPEETNSKTIYSTAVAVEPVASQLPFHPSLPARPGSAASGPVKPADAPVAPPSVAAAAVPTPVPAPPSDPWIGDDQITKYEEVMFIPKCNSG
jgi:hypothetical protein